MNQFKRVKVVMLPTNEKAPLMIDKSLLHYSKNYGFDLFDEDLNFRHIKQKHLYIISDDKFKEDEWVYSNGEIVKASSKLVDAQGLFTRRDWKKIIATTDSSLLQHVDKDIRGKEYDTQYQLPKPSQQFIQKYVEEYNKGNIIVDVLVEYEGIEWLDKPLEYFIKTNLKDNTITIKRVKESWNKEDITTLCFKMLEFIGKDEQSEVWMKLNYKQWIEENLN